MKKYISKILIYLGIISLLLGTITTFASPSYAENLEVIGNEIGLEVNPNGKKLFDLTNMNPGDTNEAEVKIKNVLDCKFELFIRTERITPQPGESEADLFKQMILTIYYDNNIIYNGSMANFAQENISLGLVNPGENKELKAIVHLPGAETGNEFQGKFVQVNWIFTAEERCEPGNPEEPNEPNQPNEPNEPNQPTEPNVPEDSLVPEQREEVKSEEKIEEPIIKEVDEIEETEETEEIEESIPEANIIPIETNPVSRASLPRTGVAVGIVYYLLGGVLLTLGIKLNKKD